MNLIAIEQLLFNVCHVWMKQPPFYVFQEHLSVSTPAKHIYTTLNEAVSFDYFYILLLY